MRIVWHDILIKNTKEWVSPNQFKFISQLAFWLSTKSGIDVNGVHFVYNTQEEWSRQLGVNRSTIQRAIKFFKDKGIIVAERLHEHYQTLYYTINWNCLKNFLEQKKEKQEKERNEKIEKLVPEMLDGIENNISENISKNTSPNNTAEKMSENNVEKQNPKTVQAMYSIIKKEFGEYINIPILSSKIAKFLHAAYNIKFNKNMNDWKNYLRLIKTSPYLMGSKFKLTLYWLLKFQTIDRILNGEFGVDSKKIKLTPDEIKDEVYEHLKNIKNPEEKLFRTKVAQILGESIYKCYFRDANVSINDNNDQIIIGIENEFLKDTITYEYLEKLRKQGYNVTCELAGNSSNSKIKKENFKEIDELKEAERCKELRKKIIKIWDRVIYDAWFAKTHMEEDNGQIKIYTNAPFNRDYLNEHFVVELKLYGYISKAFYDPEKNEPSEQIRKANEVIVAKKQEICALDETDYCKDLRSFILDTYGALEYEEWFGDNIKCIEKQSNIIEIYASSGFRKDYILSNYSFAGFIVNTNFYIDIKFDERAFNADLCDHEELLAA